VVVSRVRILSDSACDLPEDECRRYGVDLVPLSIRFENEEFTDRVTISTQEFWDRCLAQATLPETSAPSPGSFLEAFDRAADEGATGVIVVSISSKLSGTYQSAMVAAAAYQRLPVAVIDSCSVSMAQGLIAVTLSELATEGYSFDELVATGEQLVAKTGVAAMLATLDHLIKGGRIGGAKAFVGQMLSVKPLIQLRDGVVSEAGRQRTTAKALRQIVDELKAHQPLDRIAIVHANSPFVESLSEMLADVTVNHPLIVASIGPTVGTHGGPGVIGVTWLETFDDVR